MIGDRFITDRDLGDEDDLELVFAFRRSGDTSLPGAAAAWKMLTARFRFRREQIAEALAASEARVA